MLDKLYAGAITRDEARQLHEFISRGYVVLDEAVPRDVVEQLRNDVRRAFRSGDKRLITLDPRTSATSPMTRRTPCQRVALDTHAFYGPARAALLAEPVGRMLTLIFEDTPLLFESFAITRRYTDKAHQSAACVTTSSPLELATVWIAFDDVEPGAGELLVSDGTTKRMLMPRRGDAVIWAAELLHSGAPSARPDRSRGGLAGYFCPQRVEPGYFSRRRVTRAYGSCLYASSHYELPAPAVTPRGRAWRRVLRQGLS